MELLYMYVANYANSIKNQEFNFSNKFKVEYREEYIDIRLNKNYIEGFYGDTISDITAFVGKNGSGKTTILDMIGLDEKLRIESSNYDDKYNYKDQYFMIYYVNEDVFYIEGLGNFNIKNIDGFSDIKYLKNNKGEKDFFDFFIEKRSDDEFIIKADEYIEDNKNLAKVIYINDIFGNRVKEQIMYKRISSINFIQRENIQQENLVKWYDMFIKLCDNNSITSKNIHICFKKYDYTYNIGNQRIVIQPKIKGSNSNYLGRHAIVVDEIIDDFFRYFNSNIINHMLYICSQSQVNVDYYKINKFLKQLQDEDIEQYHLKIFDYFNKFIEELKEIYKEYYELIKDLFFIMIRIREYIIPAIDSFELKIDDKYNKDIYNFFYCIEEIKKFVNYNHNNEALSNIINPIEVENIRMSKGEKKLITILSKIFGEIIDYVEHSSICDLSWKKLIIVIDEIEESMHPDWSRSIINIIIKLLDNWKIPLTLKDETYDFIVSECIKVQLILSTHSPFILSDIKVDDIICLEKIGGYIERKKTVQFSNTFAQDIHYIMNNNFFMDSTIGEYCKSKINTVIKMLNSNDYKEDKYRIDIKRIIDVVGEPILKSKLEQMYNLKYNIDNDEIKKLREAEIILKKYGIDDNFNINNAIKRVEEKNKKG